MTYDWIAIYLGTGLYTHPLTIKSREIAVLDRAKFNIPYHGESSLVLKAYSITALPKVSLVPRHLSRVYFTEGEVKWLNRLAWAWVNIGSHGIFSEGDNSCVDICSILFEMECPPTCSSKIRHTELDRINCPISWRRLWKTLAHKWPDQLVSWIIPR